MHEYVLIKDGVVVSSQSSLDKINDSNLILVDELPVIGSTYENGIFTAPEIKAIRNIAPHAMRERFTFEERVLIESSQDQRVITFNNDLKFRKRLVNLDSEKLVDKAIPLLLSENLITHDRAVILLQDGTADEVN